MKKKILSLVLVVLMVALHIIPIATADEIQWNLHYRGDCGKSNLSVEWKYHTHNQTVSDQYYNNRFTLTAGGGSESGVMENYVYKNYDFYSQYASKGTRKWNGFFSSVYMINVEEGMKVIGDHAFNFGVYYNGISSSIIPYPNETISNVRYISLPSTLEEVGFCGFAGALRYVDTLTLPANLTTVDYGAFCSNGFSTVVIEDGNLTSIPSYCFANCTSLEEVYIPQCVTLIDSSAFMGCTSLKRIHYGGSQEDWEKITIYGDNDPLLSAQINFPIKTHVSSVSLNTANKTLMAGNTYQLIATVLPSNADIIDVEWTSSNPDIANVSNNGVVTAISAGTATITATSVDGGIKANCVVSVYSPTIAVTGVTLNKTTATLTEGDTLTLTATVAPTDATNKNVTWKSSDTTVATVSNGVVTAKKAGTATITVATADGNKTATCTVTVKAKTIAVTGVTLNKASATLTEGDTLTLTATVAPTNATNKNVTWKSSDTTVATVSNGVVTAKKAGTATITVTTADGSKTATCTVTVKAAFDPDALTFTVESAKAIAGKTATVDIVISNNPGIAGFSFKVGYDSSVMTLIGYDCPGWTANSSGFDEDPTNNPVGFSWSRTTNYTSNKTILTLTFEIKADAPAGEYDISLTTTDVVTNQDKEKLKFNLVGGKITVVESEPGDLNGDGDINSIDAVLLAQYIAGWDVELDGIAADCNGDGEINSIDAVLLAQFIAGWDVVLG